MCSICRCFGWILDLIQRIISFMMATVMCCAICAGCLLVTAAGIAYGYNLSLAEYIDLKPADITVYVRRGQFSDRPDLRSKRRHGAGDENDIFASNFSVDYDQTINEEAVPLTGVWQRAQDTRNYAEKLTKFSKTTEDDDTAKRTTEESIQTVPEQTRNVVNIRQFDQEYQDGTNPEENIDTVELRRSDPIRSLEREPPDFTSYGEESFYLQPNISSKVLYRRDNID